jgi:ribosomal protein S11
MQYSTLFFRLRRSGCLSPGVSMARFPYLLSKSYELLDDAAGSAEVANVPSDTDVAADGESGDDDSELRELDSDEDDDQAGPVRLIRLYGRHRAAIYKLRQLWRFSRSVCSLRSLSRIFSRTRRKRARAPRFLRSARNIFRISRRFIKIRRRYYRRVHLSRLVSGRLGSARPRFPRPVRLTKFLRVSGKRRYIVRTRRRGWRNFRRWPNVGRERSRLRRFRARRYGVVLRRFALRLRFRKRRRARRFFRRKSRLVPMSPSTRRRRRLYFVLPRAFKRRSLVYVHITRKVNNIFYSVFSRRQRLLATFSNGRTEFTGSKRMSVVATEVAAKSLAAYLRANKIRYVYFVFTTRFNQFMRAAVRVLRAKRLRIAGFKYTARRAHGLGLRARASRRV